MNVLDVPVVKYSEDGSLHLTDQVAVEEPLEIYVDNVPFYMTMRLPGEEVALALGLCFTDGLIASMDDVLGANYCSDISTNKINVYLSDSRKKRPVRDRPKQFTSYSSCGLCGSDMIRDLTASIPMIGKTIKVPFKELFPMQDVMVEKQAARRSTGATHAASIFDGQGNFLSFSEDVGRHNGLDKAIGMLLFNGRLREAKIVHLSSRLSYEMVMKAARMRAEILTGVSAATSLAIQVADALGITLIGSLREPRGNIFTHADRIE
jgi:FdhD protein